MTIVFVCTGNTCRSPMAEVMLQQLLREDEGAFQIRSAGTYASEGGGAARFAVEVMADYGLSLEHHRSQGLSGSIVEKADLLLTMTEAHRDSIVGRFPEAENKTFALKPFVGEGGDVSDPFGMGKVAYEQTAAELSRLLQGVVARLRATRQEGDEG